MLKSKFHLVKSWFLYQFNAQGPQKIHSPFVFDFYNSVLKKKYYSSEIESIRLHLINQSQTIIVEDLGAGSLKAKHKHRRISEIAKNALKPQKFSSVLHQVVQFYQPKEVIELGTSLGISTLYMQDGFSMPITTIEGSLSVAEIAQEVFDTSTIFPKPHLIIDNFNHVLPSLVSASEEQSLFYIDGNHTYEATLSYFHTIMNRKASRVCIIFDDIYWSKGMTQAWNEIKNDERVLLTIDIFYLGFVFIQPESRIKQNFILRF